MPEGRGRGRRRCGDVEMGLSSGVGEGRGRVVAVLLGTGMTIESSDVGEDTREGWERDDGRGGGRDEGEGEEDEVLVVVGEVGEAAGG